MRLSLLAARLAVIIPLTLVSICELAAQDQRDGLSTQDNTQFVIDFSGIEVFWRIFDLLRRDREPEPALWDRLFSTPGYAALEKKEHKRKTLTDAFRLAYMPSNNEKIASALEKKDFTAIIIPHLRNVTTRRKELEKYKTTFGEPQWLRRSLSRTQAFLPSGLTREHVPPAIAFVIFAPDGRGYSDLIVADLFETMKSLDPGGFFAHEFFHYYRRFIEKRYSCSRAEEPLMNLLENTQEEGIADQLDKGRIPRLSEKELGRLVPEISDRAFFDSYRKAYARANYWLGGIENVLKAYAAGSVDAPENARTLREKIPIDGRPVGAFAARTILDQFGTQKLASVAGDTLGFWLLYNDAAKKSGERARVLSQQAIGVLETLKAKPQ
jgi:hypothetical protein